MNIETKKYYSSPKKTTLQVELIERDQPRDGMPPDKTTPEAKLPSHRVNLDSSVYHSSLTSPETKVNLISESISTQTAQTDTPAHIDDSLVSLTYDQLTRLVNDGPIGKLTMKFEMYEGTDRVSFDKATHHYESDGEGNYSLRVESGQINSASHNSEPAWEIEIRGSVNQRGLRPMRYFRKGKQAQILMALSGEKIHSGESDDVSGLMPDGITDRVSLLYQFMNIEISGTEGTMQLTDGADIGTYIYRLIGTESITVPRLGLIKSQRITFFNTQNAETIDLWLASDFRNLPMKVSHRSASGEVTEQVLSSVSMQ